MANINNEVKELEKLFGWWEFYEQTQNDEAKNKAQKQIETQKKKIRTIKDAKTSSVPKRK